MCRDAQYATCYKLAKQKTNKEESFVCVCVWMMRCSSANWETVKSVCLRSLSSDRGVKLVRLWARGTSFRIFLIVVMKNKFYSIQLLWIVVSKIFFCHVLCVYGYLAVVLTQSLLARYADPLSFSFSFLFCLLVVSLVRCTNVVS